MKHIFILIGFSLLIQSCCTFSKYLNNPIQLSEQQLQILNEKYLIYHFKKDRSLNYYAAPNNLQLDKKSST